MAFDVEGFTDALMAGTKLLIARAVEPLRVEIAALSERNEALEARLSEARGVAAEIAPQIDAIARSVAAIPPAKDFGPEIEAVRAAISPAPDLFGFATKDDVAALRAEIPAVPAAPDLSGFATKAEVEAVSEAVAAIHVPEAINGKDADPEAVAALVMERVAPSLAAVDAALAEAAERINARLSEVKDGRDGVDGKDGLLPVAEEWTDRVHRRASIVRHGGALWQAVTDTGKEPPHADWICLAARGSDGITPAFVGTYDPDATYRCLEVVALNGGSFVALRDNPGACPGEGWQLLAGRGKPGPSVKGDKGDRGDAGDDAVELVGLFRSGDEIVATFADGRELRA